MAHTVEKLYVILANTYAIYLKTQSYHWHVVGPQFKALHGLFEEQYQELAEAIDEIAERIRTLGNTVPASFEDFNALKTIQDGDPHANAEQMIEDLYQDHGILIKSLKNGLLEANEADDEGTIALLADRIAKHEKSRWMLGVSRQSAE